MINMMRITKPKNVFSKNIIIWFNHEFLILILFLNILLGDILSIAFSLDSQYLVTGSDDTTIKLIDVKNLNVIHTFENVHSGTIYHNMCI